MSSPLCILELIRLTRVEKTVKNTTIIVIYKMLVYIQILSPQPPPDFNGCIALLYISSD